MRFVRFMAEVLRTAGLDVLRRPVGSLLAVAALAVALFVLGAFLVVTRGVEGAVASLRQQAVIELYFVRDTNPEEMGTLAESLEGRVEVQSVERISAERALAEFRAAFPDLQQIEELVGENPFPASLRIVPRQVDTAAVTELVDEMRTSEHVASVRYDREWIEGLSRFGRDLGHFVLAGVIVLVAAALVSLGAVVRLALDDKRDEVVVMRLVGAPTSFVVAPIFVAGALLGAVGGALGLGAAELARRVALHGAAGGAMEGLAQLVLARSISSLEVLALVLFAALAGAIAAGASAARAALR